MHAFDGPLEDLDGVKLALFWKKGILNLPWLTHAVEYGHLGVLGIFGARKQAMLLCSRALTVDAIEAGTRQVLKL